MYEFSIYTAMEFGLKKCGVLVMKRGKVVKFAGLDLDGGENGLSRWSVKITWEFLSSMMF